LLEIIFMVTGFKSHIHDLPFSIISLVISWAYIKAVWRKGAEAAQGPDPAADFVFVTMFPEVNMIRANDARYSVKNFPHVCTNTFIDLCIHLSQSLHIVLVPLFTAFYNLAAVAGIMQPLPETADRRFVHHLRYTCFTV
jgi:hypothetical protein